MGAGVCAGIREALDSLCVQSGPVLASERDVLESAGTIGNKPVWCLSRDGDAVDSRLSPTRGVGAAKALFRKALRTQTRAPVSSTLDGYTASHRAVREMPNENKARKHTKLRSPKGLNNLIEQDYRGIKSRTGPILCFKKFDCPAITIASIELLRCIREGQCAPRRPRLTNQTVRAIWNAVLAA